MDFLLWVVVSNVTHHKASVSGEVGRKGPEGVPALTGTCSKEQEQAAGDDKMVPHDAMRVDPGLYSLSSGSLILNQAWNLF